MEANGMTKTEHKESMRADIRDRVSRMFEQGPYTKPSDFKAKQVILRERGVPIYLMGIDEFLACDNCKHIYFDMEHTPTVVKMKCVTPDCRQDYYIKRTVLFMPIA